MPLLDNRFAQRSNRPGREVSFSIDCLAASPTKDAHDSTSASTLVNRPSCPGNSKTAFPDSAAGPYRHDRWSSDYSPGRSRDTPPPGIEFESAAPRRGTISNGGEPQASYTNACLAPTVSFHLCTPDPKTPLLKVFFRSHKLRIENLLKSTSECLTRPSRLEMSPFPVRAASVHRIDVMIRRASAYPIVTAQALQGALPGRRPSPIRWPRQQK